MQDAESLAKQLSAPARFATADWPAVPDLPGVYVIRDVEEVIYVGMAGRDGKGSLRRRLKDHSTGQIVNMFAQYLFLARVQFTVQEPITHPREAKVACQQYIRDRLSFSYLTCSDGAEAREVEAAFKAHLRPTLNS